MNRMLLSFAVLTLSLVSNLSAQKENRPIAAILVGENSVPPVGTLATGTLTGVLNNNWTELHYAITIEGLTPTFAHFHNGPYDSTGGIVKSLDFNDGMTISGVWSSSDGTDPFTPEMLDELLAGRIYVNIHTLARPAGEIRGNIEISVFFKAQLSGDKSVPPVTSSGIGTGGSILYGYEREFEYVLNVTGLTPTMAHFHGGSATEKGGVLKNITFFDDHMAFGDWLGDDAQSLTDSLITELLLGNIYMNIHTSANPEGEIRSQLKREDATWFLAFIIDENQVPPTSSISNGVAILTLNSAQTQVEYDITISQITPTATHFHNAGAGLTGGIVKTLDFVDGHASGVWSASDGSQPLTPELVEELLSGRLYVNIHTNALPAGEIRGQVQTFSGFSAQLSGSQSVPPVTSSGSGTFTSMFFYSDLGAELEYNITVEGLKIKEAHFHAGAAGVAGGILKTIIFDDFSNAFIVLSNDNSGHTHSVTIFFDDLHNPPSNGRILTTSTSSGHSHNLILTQSDFESLAADNTIVKMSTINSGHNHTIAIRSPGFDFANSAEGIWTANDSQPLTDEIVDMIRSGEVYVNIHTTANPGGEIRGQLLPGIIEVPVGVVDDDIAQLPTTVQLKQNFPNPFNPVTSIEYVIPFEDKIILTIYNILGEEIARLIDERQPAGEYEVTWNAANAASGIYFYRLQAGDFVQTRKMVLLK